MARFRCRVQPHGPHQIELKIRYPIERSPRAQYALDLYVFSPAQLRINRDAYGQRRFIDEVISHIRHTSPRIGLECLADPTCPRNPLRRLLAALDAAASGSPVNAEAMLDELRRLANAFRAGMRSERSAALKLASEARWEELSARLRGLVANLTRFLSQLRGLPERFQALGLARRLQVALEWADEWISLNIEVEAANIWEALQGEEGMTEAAEAMARLVRAENTHRRRAGYPSIVRAGARLANERALHHESLLKKWAQGSMYMSSEQTSTSKGIGHVIGGVAAAAAMSFAVIATFLAQQLFASYSIPWALMIVVGYIFKDRIKEALKISLSRFLPLLFSDRSGRLIDRAVSRPVGTNRETVRFCSPRECPPEVLAVRNADGNPFHDILPADNVIHYNKTVRLRTALLRAAHEDIDSITEILRIKIEPWLREMDDPVSVLRVLRRGTLLRVPVRRVYYVHMILVLAQARAPERRRVEHHLLALSREGIERIEEIQKARSGRPRFSREPPADASRPR